MQTNSYNELVKKFLLHRASVYNVKSLQKFSVVLSANFNTFGSEKSLKFIRLYALVFYMTGQRPFLKCVKFNYIKKKILKRFQIKVNLSSSNSLNFLAYFLEHYLYYFQIYYQKGIKHNHSLWHLTFYIDNPQFFIKGYNKQHQKVQFKLILSSKTAKMLQQANNFFLFRSRS